MTRLAIGQLDKLISVLGADGDWSGIWTEVTVDTNSTGFASALFIASDGNYDEADADAAATMPCTVLALETGTGAGKKVLLQGYIREDDWAWTVGGLIYASATAGGLTQTAPSGSGDQVQVVGYSVTADSIYFDPSLVLIEVA